MSGGAAVAGAVARFLPALTRAAASASALGIWWGGGSQYLLRGGNCVRARARLLSQQHCRCPQVVLSLGERRCCGPVLLFLLPLLFLIQPCALQPCLLRGLVHLHVVSASGLACYAAVGFWAGHGAAAGVVSAAAAGWAGGGEGICCSGGGFGPQALAGWLQDGVVADVFGLHLPGHIQVRDVPELELPPALHFRQHHVLWRELLPVHGEGQLPDQGFHALLPLLARAPPAHHVHAQVVQGDVLVHGQSISGLLCCAQECAGLLAARRVHLDVPVGHCCHAILFHQL